MSFSRGSRWSESQICALAGLWQTVSDDLPEVDVESLIWHLQAIQQEFPTGSDTFVYAAMLGMFLDALNSSSFRRNECSF